MIHVTPALSIDEGEIHFEFVRSGGPGGQNVNKVSTAAQLRFDVLESPNLKHEVRERVIKLAGRKMTREGVLIIQANRFRSQEKNREDAVSRLIELIREAAKEPKPRRKTKPTFKSKTKRLESKSRRSKVKQLRRPVLPSGE